MSIIIVPRAGYDEIKLIKSKKNQALGKTGPG